MAMLNNQRVIIYNTLDALAVVLSGVEATVFKILVLWSPCS